MDIQIFLAGLKVTLNFQPTIHFLEHLLLYKSIKIVRMNFNFGILMINMVNGS